MKNFLAILGIIRAWKSGLISTNLAKVYVRCIIECNCIGNGFEFTKEELEQIENQK